MQVSTQESLTHPHDDTQLQIQTPDQTLSTPSLTITTQGSAHFQQIVIRTNINNTIDDDDTPTTPPQTIPLLICIRPDCFDISIEGTDDSTGARLEYRNGTVRAMVYIPESEDPIITQITDDPHGLIAAIQSAPPDLDVPNILANLTPKD